MNRGTYKFNHALDRAMLRPVAKGYARFVPQFMQTGVHNFFTNLTYPKVMINDLLQGQLGCLRQRHGPLGRQHHDRHRRPVRSGDADGARPQ